MAKFAGIKFNFMRAIELFQDMNFDDMDVRAPPSDKDFTTETEVATRFNKYLDQLIDEGLFDRCERRVLSDDEEEEEEEVEADEEEGESVEEDGDYDDFDEESEISNSLTEDESENEEHFHDDYQSAMDKIQFDKLEYGDSFEA